MWTHECDAPEQHHLKVYCFNTYKYPVLLQQMSEENTIVK